MRRRVGARYTSIKICGFHTGGAGAVFSSRNRGNNRSVSVAGSILVVLIALVALRSPAGLSRPAPTHTIPADAFLAQFYDDITLTRLVHTEIDPYIYFPDPGNFMPWGANSTRTAREYSARWEGNWNFPTTGTYTFGVSTSKGMRVWIDRRLVIDEWRDQQATYSVDVHVNAGRHYIKVEYYFEGGGHAYAEAGWGLKIPPAPARGPNPAGTAATKAAIIAYLNSLPHRSSQKLISGQLDDLDLPGQVTTIFRRTGKWVGIENLTLEGIRSWWNLSTVQQYATDYWDRGGLVMLTDMAPNPVQVLAGKCGSSNRWDCGGGSLSPYSWNDLVTPGTAINRQWLTDLDRFVPMLTQFKRHGIVVFYSLMPEMTSGCWQWYNCRVSGAQFVNLWRQTYQYLVGVKGLDNIIWVWSPNMGNYDVSFYPGSNYVDVMASDEYARPATRYIPNDPVNYSAEAALGKPYAIASSGPDTGSGAAPCGTYDYAKWLAGMKSNFPEATMWLPWGGCYGMQAQQGVSTVLNDAWVVNRDALPDFTGTGRR